MVCSYCQKNMDGIIIEKLIRYKQTQAIVFC